MPVNIWFSVLRSPSDRSEPHLSGGIPELQDGSLPVDLNASQCTMRLPCDRSEPLLSGSVPELQDGGFAVDLNSFHVKINSKSRVHGGSESPFAKTDYEGGFAHSSVARKHDLCKNSTINFKRAARTH